MADATVDLQATNLFGLDANFNTQTSTTTVATENKPTNDESGNVACQRNVGEQTNYTQSASYCGSDFVGDLGTFLTEFGNVETIGVVESLSVNMTAGEYCTVDISGHNHTVNAHTAGLSIGYADVSDFLPHSSEGPGGAESFVAWDGFGVPYFFSDPDTMLTNASPASATATFTMNHVDVNDENGDHFTGKNITPRCELTMSFEGVLDTMTAAAIQTELRANYEGMLDVIVDSVDSGDSNSTFDTSGFAAHANTDLATV